MAPDRVATDSPTVIAKHMSDLLMRFPSAAAGGVQWQTLVSKYNDQHSNNLDIAALGYTSPLAAATALLFDSLRLVDRTDPNNPVVAVEDGLTMTAQPDAAATWPSLYQALCDIIRENGSVEKSDRDGISRGILVSQLKPLLQKHWHKEFDESSLGYYSDAGKFLKVKKMKWLLQALLQWREQRTTWKGCGRPTDVDRALQLELELISSKTRNDLELRCAFPTAAPADTCTFTSDCEVPHVPGTPSVASDSTSASSAEAEALKSQIAALNAENASLRNKNSALEQQLASGESAFADELRIPMRPASPELTNIWDDPSEPPPFEYCASSAATPCGSTAVPSSFGLGSGNMTPMTMTPGTHAATPVTWVWDGQCGQRIPMQMVYFRGDNGLSDVPSGVVQQAVSQWECHKVLPSFFTMGLRSASSEC